LDQPVVHHSDQTSTGRTVRSRLVRAFFSLSTIAMCAKVFGFAEKSVVAHFFGTGDTADVYFAVTAIVLSLIWLVRELIHPSLLPVFAETLTKSPRRSGVLFRKSFLLVAGSLAAATLLLAVFAGPFTRVLAPGFSGPKRQMATQLLRMLAPALFFLGVAMVTYTVLNARKKFVRAAFPEALLKLLIVVGLVALVPSMGIYALALVMGVGGLGCLLAHLCFIPERRSLMGKQDGGQTCPAFHKMLLLMGPLVVGVAFSHANGLIDNLLASMLPTGQLSYLGYAKKLIDALLLVGPIALVTVVYSQLSHLASANQRSEFTLLVTRVVRLLVYLTVPAGCILTGLREPLIRLLFQRGEFGTASTLGTSQAFMVYALGLTVFSLEALLVHTFFALSDTKTPVKLGIVCGLLDVALALVLLRPLQYLGIAYAFLVARTAKVAVLGILLNRRLEGVCGLGMLGFLAKLAVSGCTAWVTLRSLLGAQNEGPFLHMAFYDLMLPATGAALAFAVSSHLLKIDEFRAAIALLRRRRAAIPPLYTESK
jgi:putative peptidoglycan lipid II flippase